MRVGERADFAIPAKFAYGAEGFSDFGIEPNSPLKFDLELLRVDAGTTSGTSTGSQSNRLQPSIPFEAVGQVRLVAGKVAVKYKPPSIGLEFSITGQGVGSARADKDNGTDAAKQNKAGSNAASRVVDADLELPKQVMIVPLPLKGGSSDAGKVVEDLLRGEFGCATYFAAVKKEQLTRVVTVLLRNLAS